MSNFHSQNTISDGTGGACRVKKAIGGITEERVYKTRFITVGCTRLIFENKRWKYEIVYRQSGTKQHDDQRWYPLSRIYELLDQL